MGKKTAAARRLSAVASKSAVRARITLKASMSISDQVLAFFNPRKAHSVIPSEVEGPRHGALKITPRDPSTSLRAAQDDGCGNAKNILITFWVVVPAKTKPRDFFQFLQQQGYLRIWLNGDIIRVDSDAKIEHHGERVQVMQDRIVVSEENRARLTEAIETALRFGKGKINVIPFSVAAGVSPAIKTAADTAAATDHEFPFSTGWHCA